MFFDSKLAAKRGKPSLKQKFVAKLLELKCTLMPNSKNLRTGLIHIKTIP